MSIKKFEEFSIKENKDQETDKPSYYRKELDKIATDGEYNATVKFSHGGESTKTINVNKESAADIIAWLKERFSL